MSGAYYITLNAPALMRCQLANRTSYWHLVLVEFDPMKASVQ